MVPVTCVVFIVGRPARLRAKRLPLCGRAAKPLCLGASAVKMAGFQRHGLSGWACAAVTTNFSSQRRRGLRMAACCLRRAHWERGSFGRHRRHATLYEASQYLHAHRSGRRAQALCRALRAESGGACPVPGRTRHTSSERVARPDWRSRPRRGGPCRGRSQPGGTGFATGTPRLAMVTSVPRATSARRALSRFLASSTATCMVCLSG
jgi:hypothetical protein